MTTRRARRPYRWLRRGLLLLLIGVVVGLGGLFWFGRQDRQPPVRRGEPLGSEGPQDATLGDVATVGQGFEYTHYDAGRKQFTLRALRTVQDRQETVFLEGVDMLVYEEAGAGYELSADKARYNREKQEALLEGRVRLSSGAGMTLITEGLELSQRGRVLTSTAPAEILYGDAYKATGDVFRVHVPEDLFLLTGNARIDNLPGKGEPFALRSKRLQLERKRQLLRADGGVEVTRPDGWVTAQNVNVFLSEDLASVRFLRARWEVEGYSLLPLQASTQTAEPATERYRVDFSGRSFSTLLGPEGDEPQSAELEGTPTEPATLTTREGDLVRTITAGFLTSETQPDGSQVVEAFGEPEIVERGGETPRRLEGGRGWARILADGGLGQARMSEGVIYRAGEVEIRGERGRFDLAAGEGSFVGTESAEGLEGDDAEVGTAKPRGPRRQARQAAARVTVKSPRADLDAPKVTFAEKDGVVHARGGVSTVLHEGLVLPGQEPGERAAEDDASAESGEEAPPVRVESREAFFRDQPSGALFRGEVRAWQGESLILADWLRADEPADGPAKVSAGGGVRTVARPSPTASRPEPEPLTVTAREMSYLDQERAELIYEKEVKALDQGREIACERLAVTLDQDGAAERLEAHDQVRLNDPAAGKKAQAQRAVWLPEGRPGGGRVALFGNPAVVTDSRGGEIKAPELTYELGTGRVQAGVTLPALAMRGGR